LRYSKGVDLRGVSTDDEIELSRENVITVFATTRTIPSAGKRFLLFPPNHP
jgi:hypothetical protein